MNTNYQDQDDSLKFRICSRNVGSGTEYFLDADSALMPYQARTSNKRIKKLLNSEKVRRYESTISTVKGEHSLGIQCNEDTSGTFGGFGEEPLLPQQDQRLERQFSFGDISYEPFTGFDIKPQLRNLQIQKFEKTPPVANVMKTLPTLQESLPSLNTQNLALNKSTLPSLKISPKTVVPSCSKILKISSKSAGQLSSKIHKRGKSKIRARKRKAYKYYKVSSSHFKETDCQC